MDIGWFVVVDEDMNMSPYAPTLISIAGCCHKATNILLYSKTNPLHGGTFLLKYSTSVQCTRV